MKNNQDSEKCDGTTCPHALAASVEAGELVVSVLRANRAFVDSPKVAKLVADGVAEITTRFVVAHGDKPWGREHVVLYYKLLGSLFSQVSTRLVEEWKPADPAAVLAQLINLAQQAGAKVTVVEHTPNARTNDQN